MSAPAPTPPRTETYRALQLRTYDPRRAFAWTVGRVHADVRRGGFGSPLRLTERPRPHRPTGWVRIRPRLAGICASDRKFLDITGWGRVLTYGGIPRAIIPGHEIVGTVVECDADSGFSEGDRVVAEPILSCLDKGLDLCVPCRRGEEHRCTRIPIAGDRVPGHGFGHNAEYGGGWGEELVAPARRVFAVPDDLDDRDAVLAEPTAIGVHAVARNLPPEQGRVLVIGPGTIGLAIVHALRILAPDTSVTVAGLGHFADALATTAGAHSLIHGSRADLITAAGETLGTDVHGGRISGPVLEDGFDVVYDAVGSTQTIDDALRMVRPGGRIALIGTSIDQAMDWSLVWWREVTIRGVVYYAHEDVTPRAIVEPGRRRTMEIALEVLREVRPGSLVTHIFRLEEATDALRTAEAGPGAGAVKVAFAPTE